VGTLKVLDKAENSTCVFQKIFENTCIVVQAGDDVSWKNIFKVILGQIDTKEWAHSSCLFLFHHCNIIVV